MIRCPICRWDKCRFVLRIDRIWKKKYEVYHCSRCGLFFLDKKPTIKEVMSYYNGDYYAFSKFKQMFKDFFRFLRSKSQYEYIRQLINPHNKKILEIGACDGMLLSLFKKDNTITGTEYATKYIESGEEKYGIQLLRKDYEDIRKCYDCIIMSHVFEHFLDIHRHIKNLLAKLNVGGYLFIEVPNSPNFSGMVNSELDEFLQTTHIYNFNTKNIVRLFENYGMKIIDISRFYYNIPEFYKKKVKKDVARVLIKGNYLSFGNFFPVGLYFFGTLINPISAYKAIDIKSRWYGQGDYLRLLVQKISQADEKPQNKHSKS